MTACDSLPDALSGGESWLDASGSGAEALDFLRNKFLILSIMKHKALVLSEVWVTGCLSVENPRDSQGSSRYQSCQYELGKDRSVTSTTIPHGRCVYLIVNQANDIWYGSLEWSLQTRDFESSLC